MATTRTKNHNRYRIMRSAILTGSLLSILPLFVLMKSGAVNVSASVHSAATTQRVVAAGAAQTTSTQNTASQAAASTSSSTKTTTHTRTKAS